MGMSRWTAWEEMNRDRPPGQKHDLNCQGCVEAGRAAFDDARKVNNENAQNILQGLKSEPVLLTLEEAHAWFRSIGVRRDSSRSGVGLTHGSDT